MLALTAKQKSEYEESFAEEEVEVLVEEVWKEENLHNKCENAWDIVLQSGKMYTGYTERYMKAVVKSDRDCVNQLIKTIF